MKIQSHELEMQTSHSMSRTYEKSEVSFSTFFTDIPFNANSDMDAKDVETPEVEEMNPSMFTSDTPRTISSILQSLMNSLFEKTNSMMESASNKIGCSHLSVTERFEEHESLSYSTMGKIKTDSGELDINVNFSMSRSFMIENQIDIYSEFDPLVINMNGGIPDLSTDTFNFDLDNDGTSDQISRLGSGNGFLALDKNEDGEINQGSELFGTITGNGFEELAHYDEDGNQWIDESDSIFDKLRIWLKNDDESSSEKELVGLGESGIGAIYLNSASSEFTYKTQTNQTLGEMKSCGMFLNEDGTCGNISQIDFAARAIQEASNNTQEVSTAANTKQKEPLASLLQA
ncbi:MAG: hypothetical protein U9N42_03440 [Campylobacterota bacterium]|nr:hypothetical protein [Campylobacterota bacterium]